ncbi:hypothetical protein Ahy_A04g019415 isoform G [Arachis hypogaea]|uniref:Uncharacterized protein n=1 Tax=Arachis hypogaea TaxID=3818 RepID=A0A445DFV4_ARAHY|nr:hypothetical protein Ahy_A04g019415 isoform G [Arachis hypogaea]
MGSFTRNVREAPPPLRAKPIKNGRNPKQRKSQIPTFFYVPVSKLVSSFNSPSHAQFSSSMNLLTR